MNNNDHKRIISNTLKNKQNCMKYQNNKKKYKIN